MVPKTTSFKKKKILWSERLPVLYRINSRCATVGIVLHRVLFFLCGCLILSILYIKFYPVIMLSSINVHLSAVLILASKEVPLNAKCKMAQEDLEEGVQNLFLLSALQVLQLMIKHGCYVTTCFQHWHSSPFHLAKEMLVLSGPNSAQM